MTKAQIDKIKDEYASGKSISDIAFDNYVCETTVYRCIKGKAIPEEVKRDRMISIAEEYLSGLTSKRDILKKYNISESSLYYYISKYHNR